MWFKAHILFGLGASLCLGENIFAFPLAENTTVMSVHVSIRDVLRPVIERFSHGHLNIVIQLEYTQIALDDSWRSRPQTHFCTTTPPRLSSVSISACPFSVSSLLGKVVMRTYARELIGLAAFTKA